MQYPLILRRFFFFIKPLFLRDDRELNSGHVKFEMANAHSGEDFKGGSWIHKS